MKLLVRVILGSVCVCVCLSVKYFIDFLSFRALYSRLETQLKREHDRA